MRAEILQSLYGSVALGHSFGGGSASADELGQVKVSIVGRRQLKDSVELADRCTCQREWPDCLVLVGRSRIARMGSGSCC